MVMMKESCINMYNIFDITFREMNVNQLAVWFFIYSFFGWAMECIVIRKQLGYWENKGFCQASVLRYIWLWRVYSISYICTN